MDPNQNLRAGSPQETAGKGSSWDSQPERRASIRYAISRNLHYTMISGGGRRDYSGIISNMSTEGLLFSAENIPALGEHLVLLIRWPWQWNRNEEYRLVIEGRVVRATGNTAAVLFETLDICTADSRPLSATELLKIMQG